MENDRERERIRQNASRLEIVEAAVREYVKDAADHEERLRSLERYSSELRGFTRALVFLASSGVIGSLVALVIALSKGHA